MRKWWRCSPKAEPFKGSDDVDARLSRRFLQRRRPGGDEDPADQAAEPAGAGSSAFSDGRMKSCCSASRARNYPNSRWTMPNRRRWRLQHRQEALSAGARAELPAAARIAV
ncbi:hypothetical protein M8494_05150 [Serratia ureilytica]